MRPQSHQSSCPRHLACRRSRFSVWVMWVAATTSGCGVVIFCSSDLVLYRTDIPNMLHPVRYFRTFGYQDEIVYDNCPRAKTMIDPADPADLIWRTLCTIHAVRSHPTAENMYAISRSYKSLRGKRVRKRICRY